jgi:hypothetical protein
MTASLHKRPLRLTLHPNDVLPEAMSWRVVEGYVRSLTWDWEGESITLGLWGPGDVISSEDPPPPTPGTPLPHHRGRRPPGTLG